MSRPTAKTLVEFHGTDDAKGLLRMPQDRTLQRLFDPCLSSNTGFRAGGAGIEPIATKAARGDNVRLPELNVAPW